MNKHNLNLVSDVHKIENLLHKTTEVMRDKITTFVEANWNS